MSGPIEHMLGGFKPFGLRRCCALCSCGYETRPVEGSGGETQREAARRLLITEHGARDRYPGEAVWIPYAGGSGPASAAP